MPGLDTWVALLVGLFGGALLKAVEHFFTRSAKKVEEENGRREELRTEISYQRERIKELEAELDKWKTQLYDLKGEFSVLEAKYTLAIERLKDITNPLENNE